MRRFSMTTILTLPAMAGLLLLAAPKAEAQCAPDSAFCAEVNVGSSFNARAQVRVRHRNRVRVRTAPPPVRSGQVVVVQPAEPAPPPPPPQPQAQPPVVVVQGQAQQQPQPQAQTTVVVTSRQQQQQAQQQRQPRRRSWGIHPSLSAMLGRQVQMGGFRIGPRFRPRAGHFALEVDFGYYAGTDYNGLDRSEIPIGINTLFFFNPQHRLQFYAVLGLGLSWGSASGINRFTGAFDDMSFAHFNGEGGIGIEWRIASWFALNLDVRALIRHRISDSPRAEFVEFDDLGNPTGRTSNTSAGALLNFGGVFYF
jgi:hypothetical protein